MPSSTLSSSGNFQVAEVDANQNKHPMVMLEYLGEATGSFSVRSRVRVDQGVVIYRFANTPGHKVKAVFLEDAEYLVGLVGADGKQQYRMVASNGSQTTYDPAAFIGQSLGN